MIPKVTARMSEHSIKASLIEDAGYLNLRGKPDDAAFGKAVKSAIGQSLPTDPNKISAGDLRVYWMGPDEWLLVVPGDSAAMLAGKMQKALAKQHAAVNDVSGGNVAVHLAGSNTRKLFAKGCTLDFHPDVFPVGACAQSGLGKAPVLFGLLDDKPTFELIVRRSFAEYLVKWLRHAGDEYGIEFV